MVVGGFVLACLGLLALFFLSNRSQTGVEPGPERPIATPSAALMPSLLPATPTPTPAPVVVPRPRGSLLISTDTSADVFVDGLRNGLLRAGGMQQVQVSPGEHIVSFHIGEARYDRLVRVREGEQAVVPFTQEVAPESPSLPPPLPSVSSTPASSSSPAVHPALPFSTPLETASPTPTSAGR
jgi:hypothetical protein